MRDNIWFPQLKTGSRLGTDRPLWPGQLRALVTKSTGYKRNFLFKICALLFPKRLYCMMFLSSGNISSKTTEMCGVTQSTCSFYLYSFKFVLFLKKKMSIFKWSHKKRLSAETRKSSSLQLEQRVNLKPHPPGQEEGGSNGRSGWVKEGRVGGLLTGTSHWKCLLCELVRLSDHPGPPHTADFSLWCPCSAKLTVRASTLHRTCDLSDEERS